MNKLFLLIIITIIISGCSHTTGKITQPQDETNKEINSTGEIKEFNIVAKKWDFEPTVLEVNEGDLVKINIKSIDVNHGIAIPEFNVNQKFSAGEEVSFEFIALKKGEFNFFCNVFCGSGHGSMNGKLIVK